MVKSSVKEHISAGLQEYGEVSSLHGVREVLNRNCSLRKRILWLVCFLSCTGYLGYYFYIQVSAYYNYPTAINMKKMNNFLPLPAITLFNLNELRFTHIKSADLNSAIANYYFGMNENCTDIDPTVKIFLGENRTRALLSKAKIARKLKKHEDFDYAEFVQRVSHQLVDFIPGCTWYNGLDGKRNCTDVFNITQRMCWPFGNMYTFNRNGQLALYGSGYSEGLELLLNLEPEEWFGFRRRLKWRVENRIGLYLVIHHPLRDTMTRGIYFFIDLKQSNRYVITLTKVSVLTYLPPPWNECEDDVSSYLDENCIDECTTHNFYDLTGCKLYDMPGDYPVCLHINNSYLLTTNLRNQPPYMNRCRKACKASCRRWEYVYEIKPDSVDFTIPYGFIAVWMKVKDVLRFENNTEVPLLTASAVVADIGGMTSLMVGASLLTMVQLLQFVMTQLYFIISTVR